MNLKNSIKNFIDRLPYIRTLKRENHFYESQLASMFVPPGHFYSPLISVKEILENENEIFNPQKTLKGINLNKIEQLELLEKFKNYYNSLFFPEDFNSQSRYYYNNTFFSYSDVIFLFSIIMHYKPSRIIEIGSGFSSAALLDINERYFNNSIDLTFIEPNPEILKSLLRKNDKISLIEKKVQQVDISIFESLQENDILFIDSTHIAKTNSDVLYEIFEIFPVLNKGVKIHIHDIFYPFEYPKNWIIEDKRSWNELYFIRSFLMYNKHFKIIAFNTYLEMEFKEWFEINMPFCLKNIGGSCWLEKVG